MSSEDKEPIECRTGGWINAVIILFQSQRPWKTIISTLSQIPASAGNAHSRRLSLLNLSLLLSCVCKSFSKRESSDRPTVLQEVFLKKPSQSKISLSIYETQWSLVKCPRWGLLRKNLTSLNVNYFRKTVPDQTFYGIHASKHIIFNKYSLLILEISLKYFS